MFSKMFKKKNRLGFSLIEMLVVIAIVAILVSIIVPTITRATLKSAAATNAANLRAIEGQIGTLRVMNADKFEDLDYKELEDPDAGSKDDFWGSLGNLIGVYGSKVATYTADENGVLQIGDDLTVENVPGAKAMTITKQDGTTREIAEGTCMTVYISETGVAATYNSVSRDNFADVAEDGSFDGELEKTQEEKEEDAKEDIKQEIVQAACKNGHTWVGSSCFICGEPRPTCTECSSCSGWKDGTTLPFLGTIGFDGKCDNCNHSAAAHGQ